MARLLAPWAGLLSAIALLAGAGSGSSAAAEPAASGSATVDLVRAGRTAKGAVRVVFEVSRPVEYLTVELPHGNGFEVHLLDTDAGAMPEPLPVGEGGVSQITFRTGPSGVVARILGGEQRLAARTFALSDPPRVVVDIAPENEESAAASSRTAVAAPAVTAKRPRTDTPTPRSEPEEPVAAAPTPPREPVAQSPPATPESADVREVSDEEFDDLLGWITGVKLEVEALVLSETEADRARYRRSLAFRLAERGLLSEAEKTLAHALESEGHDPATAFADSVYLADLRLQLGDEEGAAAIARALPAEGGETADHVRLANLLLKCRFPDLAVAHLEPIVTRLLGKERVKAQLLLARAHWDRRDAAKALPLVAKLTESKYVPPELLGSALVLEGDCLWALDRASEAAEPYRRALGLELSDEEASWATLQLGNFAHRSGRVADAVDYYRRARDRWPETFYGAQADWFLRVAEHTERLESAEVVRDRG